MSKKIQTFIERLENIKDDLEAEQSALQEKFDSHTSDKWYETEIAEKMEEQIFALSDAADSVGDAIDYLLNVK